MVGGGAVGVRWGLQQKITQNTFAVAFIPGKDAVLNAVTHQRGVDAHVAVAEERAARTGSCNTENAYGRPKDKKNEAEINILSIKTGLNLSG